MKHDNYIKLVVAVMIVVVPRAKTASAAQKKRKFQ
jgi:hypothetical protein